MRIQECKNDERILPLHFGDGVYWILETALEGALTIATKKINDEIRSRALISNSKPTLTFLYENENDFKQLDETKTKLDLDILDIGAFKANNYNGMEADIVVYLGSGDKYVQTCYRARSLLILIIIKETLSNNRLNLLRNATDIRLCKRLK